MSIRSAIIEDVVQIASLVQSLTHYYLDDSSSELPLWFAETLTPDAVKARIESSNYLNLVYEVDGSIVGYIALKGGSHLYHLFVSEAYQGNGIARSLWEAAIADSAVACFTLRSSLFAVPVYRRFGFEASGPPGSKDGISYQLMELRLI